MTCLMAQRVLQARSSIDHEHKLMDHEQKLALQAKRAMDDEQELVGRVTLHDEMFCPNGPALLVQFWGSQCAKAELYYSYQLMERNIHRVVPN